MAKYTSGRQRNLKIGISSFSEDLTSLEVIGKVGIGTTNATSALTVQGDVLVSGVTTSLGGFVGNLTGIASTATKLQTPRTFEITGDVVASPISFDGTGNVSLAATIQPNSVGLGTDTFGDYVQTITGTSNEITITGGTGEGSSPIVSISTNPTLPGNVTVQNDLTVNNNLNVSGNITIGGTTVILNAEELRVEDKNIVLGFTTTQNPDDTTANSGGVAIASTVGSPLVSFSGINTLPETYKQIMWVKSGTGGMGTDAWLFNYGVGIGSTQVPNGVRLAVGKVQITDSEVTATRFIGTATSLDIDGLPTVADPQSGDYIALYDVSGVIVGKATIQNAALQ